MNTFEKIVYVAAALTVTSCANETPADLYEQNFKTIQQIIEKEAEKELAFALRTGKYTKEEAKEIRQNNEIPFAGITIQRNNQDALNLPENMRAFPSLKLGFRFELENGKKGMQLMFTFKPEDQNGRIYLIPLSENNKPQDIYIPLDKLKKVTYKPETDKLIFDIDDEKITFIVKGQETQVNTFLSHTSYILTEIGQKMRINQTLNTDLITPQNTTNGSVNKIIK